MPRARHSLNASDDPPPPVEVPNLHRPLAPTLVACPDCDLLQHIAQDSFGAAVVCTRCRALLLKPAAVSHEVLLALAVAGLIMLALANAFPLASLSVQGQVLEATLPAAVHTLWVEDLRLLAVLVGFTTIFAPAAELFAFIYVLAHLQKGSGGRLTRPALRFLHAVEEWNMTEVFMLGALVALVKLGDYAQLHFGIALWSLGGAMLLMAMLGMRFEPDDAWRTLRPGR